MSSISGTAAGESSDGKTKRIPAVVLQSVTALLLLCAKQAITASQKLKNSSKLSQGSPKKLVSSISNKAIKLRRRKKKAGEDDGVWRKEILMGDKCQPLDFSGVIYYDKDGNLLSELPTRSPRASPLPGYVCTPAKSRWASPGRRDLPSP